jgi:iron complex transport system substrate-binding protein
MRSGSSSFLKKRTKKLLLISVRTVVTAASTNIIKVFWFFFSKKNCFLLLSLLAVSPASASGVVSLNLCTDQLLVLLAPEQVTALEPLARDPALSVVADAAARLPSVRADAEAVLRLHPGLVLAGRYGAQATVTLLKARGVQVLQVDEPEDFVHIAALVTQLADALGVAGRGRALNADMWRKLAAIRKRNGTAVLWQAGGWTAGPGGLGDAVLRAAGLTDVGTGGRIGLEKLLAYPPALLVTETAPRFPSMATDLARHPALAGIPRRDVPARLLICGGPFTADAVALLAR